MKRVCVYCGSSSGASPGFAEAARRVGRLLAERGFGLVFGGGSVGLMGLVAEAYAAAGGRESIGVIPEKFGLELSSPVITRLHVVATMHERKQLLFDLADGFIALPGGPGTVEELMEVLTWARQGARGKPIGLLNVEGYYRHLLAFLDEMTEGRFWTSVDRQMLLDDDSATRLLDRMLAYVPPEMGAAWTRVEAGVRAQADAGPAAAPTGGKADLARFDPQRREFIEDPYPFYARYRAEDPVHWGLPQVPGQPGCWYLFRYDEVTAVLRDQKFRRRWPPNASKDTIHAAPDAHRPFLEIPRTPSRCSMVPGRGITGRCGRYSRQPSGGSIRTVSSR